MTRRLVAAAQPLARTGATSRRPALRRVVEPPTPSGMGLASDRARDRMVETIAGNGVRDGEVLAAMRFVPRHLFVDAALASRAYEDVSLPIGHAQTISRPTTVARMIELVAADLPGERRREARVLEIGTGCGYQAAVMARVFGEVISIERIRGLHEAARGNVRTQRLANLRLVFGDGRMGVPQAAPYDAVIIAAACDQVPEAVLGQMRIGSSLVAPVAGSAGQSLHRIERVGERDWRVAVMDPVHFVPLRGGTT